jgi:hypothetical protein
MIDDTLCQLSLTCSIGDVCMRTLSTSDRSSPNTHYSAIPTQTAICSEPQPLERNNVFDKNKHNQLSILFQKVFRTLLNTFSCVSLSTVGLLLLLCSVLSFLLLSKYFQYNRAQPERIISQRKTIFNFLIGKNRKVFYIHLCRCRACSYRKRWRRTCTWQQRCQRSRSTF